MYLAYKAVKKRRDARKRGEEKPKTKPCIHQGSIETDLESKPAPDTEISVNETPQPPQEQPSATATSSAQKCTQCAEEKRSARIYRWKLIAGLMIPSMLAALDLTIVATAAPRIAADFDKFNQLNWIATAYSLCSTAFIPAFGQLADVLGRHAVLQLSMGFSLVGSVLAAAAQTWGMFLLGRALQGVSAAGLMNIIKIVLADKVSLEENSKNTTLFSLVSGISYGIGPTIGGYLTAASWRYCFVLPIPLSVIASAILFFLLRPELVHGTHQASLSFRRPRTFFSVFRTIDIGGTLLFIFGVGLIIVATAWGGSTYAWSSPKVLAPLIIGSVLFFAFFFYEYLLEPGNLLNRKFPTQVPMLPWHLFRRLDVLRLAVINSSTGAALYSVFYFSSVYFTVALGVDSADAGVSLLFYLPGLSAGVYLTMVAVNIWPGSTFLPLLLGSILEAAGFGLLAWAVTTTKSALVKGFMGLAGVGTGLRFMPCTLHGVGIWPDRIAAVLSLMDFALPFGGTLALTIMGSVFNNKLADLTGFSDSVGQGSSQHGQGLGAIRQLPPALQQQYRSDAGTAVMWAFVSILPVMGCCVIAALFLGNVWVKGNKKDGTAQVVFSSYLLALLTGTVAAKKTVNRETEAKIEEVKQ